MPRLRPLALIALLTACSGEVPSNAHKASPKAAEKPEPPAPFPGVTLPTFTSPHLRAYDGPALILIATPTEIHQQHRRAAGDTGEIKPLAPLTDGQPADPAAFDAAVRREYEALRTSHPFPAVVLALDTRLPASAVVAIFAAVRAAQIDSVLLAVASDPPTAAPVATYPKYTPDEQDLRIDLLPDGDTKVNGHAITAAKFPELFANQMAYRADKVALLRPHPSMPYGDVFPHLVRLVDERDGGVVPVAELPTFTPPVEPVVPASSELQPLSAVEPNFIYRPLLTGDAAKLVKTPTRYVFCVEPDGKVLGIQPDDTIPPALFTALDTLAKKWRSKPARTGARVCVHDTVQPPAK